jgi:hypothetical protein
MHTVCANSNPCTLMLGATSLPAMRISGPNLRAGNEA